MKLAKLAPLLFVRGLIVPMFVLGLAFSTSSSALTSKASSMPERSAAQSTNPTQARATGLAEYTPRVAMKAQTNQALLERRATKLGPHAGDSEIELTFGLKLRGVRKLENFLINVQDSHNPDYRHFLTPEEFTARYGPTEAQVSRVVDFLRRYGITVTGVSPNRILIHTEATTTTYEHALEIRVSDYTLKGRAFFSTADNPRIPKSISGIIQNIIGLNNAVQMHPMSHLGALPGRSDKAAQTAAYGISENAPPPATSAYYNPLQIATAYEWPAITKASNGAGVTTAIITASSSNLSGEDYQGFWSALGLPSHTVELVPVDGDKGNTDGTVETLLDIEYSGAMGPGENLKVYVASDPSFATFTDAYNQLVEDNSAQVMTTSWGAPEIYGGAETDNEIFEEAAALGISMFAAAGDSGSSDGTPQGNMADFPSSSPYITAANGTVLNATAGGAYISEKAWSDTGGAISSIFDEPSWQRGPGVPQNGWRNNSDMAMNAGEARPYLLLYEGQWHTVWGTSAVAPELAGLFAIGVSQNGGLSLGQSNKLIYDDINARNYKSDFRDVTTGCNGAYCAGTDWDHPTGWGSPRATHLLSHLGVQGPHGTLVGSVTAATSGGPIKSAEVVSAPAKRAVTTDDEGKYQLPLSAGTHTVTASAFGYLPQTKSIVIHKDEKTEQDFQLEKAPVATVTGNVSDGSGHGWPLYADVRIFATGYGQVAETWTDPKTGNYQVRLPKGIEYKFVVDAYVNGYDSGSASFTLDHDITQRFSLKVGASCQAPGYALPFGENFNGSSFPPKGWSVTESKYVRGAPVIWKTNVDWQDQNFTGSSGLAADVDSNGAGALYGYEGPFDTSLVSPEIEVSSLSTDAKLKFKLNFQPAERNKLDAFDVDVRSDGGDWINADHIVTSQGGYYAPPGVTRTVELGPYIASGAKTIQIRWRYYDLRARENGWYAQIDDVSIGNCAPVAKSLVEGSVTDANTHDGLLGATVSSGEGASAQTFDNLRDANLPKGYYFLFVNPGKHSIMAARSPYETAGSDLDVNNGSVRTMDFSLKAGELSSDTGSIHLDVPVGGKVTKTFVLRDIGSAALHWAIRTFNFGEGQSQEIESYLESFPPDPPSSPDVRAACGGAIARGGKVRAFCTSANAGAHNMVRPAATGTGPGSLVASFSSPVGTYGLGVDRDNKDLWISSSSYLVSGGDDKLHRFLFNGTDTGDAIDVSTFQGLFMADMAYDDRTSTLWELNVADGGAHSCIFELNTRTRQWTGRKICPPFPQAQLGLAYDPVSNTWYAGSLNSFTIYHFDSEGHPLDSMYVGLPVIGLAYNSATGHLFVLNSNGSPIGLKQVTVLDAKNGYARVGSFDVEGLPEGNAAAGFDYDCQGRLWVSDTLDHKVFEVNSGETGWCAHKNIPWLTIAPPSGTLSEGEDATVTLTVDGVGEKAFTTSRGQLLLANNTPYGSKAVPVTVSWTPQSVDLVVSGEANVDSVNKGGNLVYTLTVTNKRLEDHGDASGVVLSYVLPAGVSFVPDTGGSCKQSGGTVSCALGELDTGSSKTITIAVKAEQAGKLESKFVATAAEPQSPKGDNEETIGTTVTGVADVSASATAGGIAVNAEGPIGIVVRNAGPDVATGVALHVSADSGIGLEGASISEGSCSAEDGDISCQIGDLASGAEVKLTVTAAGLKKGSASVRAQVLTSAQDPDQTNNVAAAEVGVKGGSNSGGGGAFGWLALAALLALGGIRINHRRNTRASAQGADRAMIGRVLALAAVLAGVGMLGTELAPSASAHEGSFAKRLITAKKFKRTQPLRDMRWTLPPIMQRILANHRHLSKAEVNRLRNKLTEAGFFSKNSWIGATQPIESPPASGILLSARDTVVQRRVVPSKNLSTEFTGPILNFDGLGHTTGYDVAESLSPDPVLAVGEKYVMDMVNAAFAIFDKSDGEMVLGPVKINALWSGFGGYCEDDTSYPLNIGGPVVIYDQLAHRWIIDRVATDADPHKAKMYACLAVSQTDDPTGAWYLYSFQVANERTDKPFIMYPKIGLWRNSYLASWKLRKDGGLLPNGSIVGAFDRTALLNGDPDAKMVEFAIPVPNKGWAYNAYLLPASLDGMTPPPVNEPGYFMNYSSPNVLGEGSPYALLLWRLSVDWSTPSAATLAGPATIDVAPFTDYICANIRQCIPQPQFKLPAHSNRLMYRLAYRNFGDHEAMVVNQTVGVNDSGNPPTGIRWYELDTSAPGAEDWSVGQQGTFAPDDGKSRWTGSIAMDRNGDIALGYSVSGPETNPSIGYTGRHASDPAGKMTEPETILQAGGGYEARYSKGWGEYTSMAVDPFGDCNFWYSNEYYTSSGTPYWSTRIGAFKFSSCTPEPIGTLSGTVTAAASGTALADAIVTLTGGIVTKTDAKGHYSIELAVDQYTATASDFSYLPSSSSITISGGKTTTQNFQLVLAPNVTLSGRVTDGSGHGYGLYAGIAISSPGYGQVAQAWTDPMTGDYSVKLPQGFRYTLKTSAWFSGYEPQSASLTLNGDGKKDFALSIGSACEAPGYSFAFAENFNGEAFPPDGWKVTNDVADSPVVWKTDSAWEDDNWTGGSGLAATADSNAASSLYSYTGPFDTSLVTPQIAVSSLPVKPRLSFKVNYFHYGGADALDVDISVDGGAWETIDHIVTQQGGYAQLPGVTVSIPLKDHIPAGAKNVRFRWRYYDRYSGDDWYVEVDDTTIGTCAPLPGGLLQGQMRDANTGMGLLSATVEDDQDNQARTFENPQDASLPTGYYFLFSPSGDHKFTATRPPYQTKTLTASIGKDQTQRQNFTLDAGEMAVNPDELSLQLKVGEKTTKTLRIDDVGMVSAHWLLRMLDGGSPKQLQPSGPFAQVPLSLPEWADAPADLAAGALPRPPSQTVFSAAASPGTAGAVISSFVPRVPTWSLGVDRDRNDLWLGSPNYGGIGGDDKDHRTSFDGTDTGEAIDTSSFQGVYMADMAYDGNTGMFWQISAEGSHGKTCIYELDPRFLRWTGRKICPSFVGVASTPRALAYDPTTNTWYSGFAVISHFDATGKILDSIYLDLPVFGLAYNAHTGHLFALIQNGPKVPVNPVLVLDAKHGYARIGSFNIKGLALGQEGPGLGYDCDGHLWVSAGPEDKVFEVASGESGWCGYKHIPWLTASPASGTLSAGAGATVMLTFDGTGQEEFTASKGRLLVFGADTPYKPQTIPVTVTWTPQSIDLVVAGRASPEPIDKNNVLVYTLTVTNKRLEDHGDASGVVLSYVLPAGVSFVPDTGGSCKQSGGTVSCALGELDTGSSKTITIAVKAEQAGKLESKFVATAAEPQSPKGDNEETIGTTVTGVADVSASATAGGIAVNAEGPIGIVVRNAGPDVATGVALHVSADSGIGLEGASISEGSCSAEDGDISCQIGDLASGAEVKLTVTAAGLKKGSASVRAQVLTSAQDPDQTNNVAAAEVGVKGGSNSGGGGAFGWLALAALLALGSGAATRRGLGK